MNYGSKVRELRLGLQLGLRAFCIRAGVDPSNLSKIERGRLAPPEQGTEVFGRIADALNISAGSDEFDELAQLAEIGKGKIPKAALSDSEIAGKLPAFFRTITGQPISNDDRRALIEMIRNA